ncbi:poly A polymerase regulatory subunit [Bodo saltans virus]|uniref:Cap-specific mRNA (nucleoside-2'-O-)-methyltransferase n=1 Tax=Bodo saltans virus TaxID=2024608 RepID=A0A2H4UTZ3_9VIRU|nr:poly A polymerase regulatory subunit [Bodo saltans virus]ATZ80344.1 poly A polymerase regulatory subunit [Bodo saltans virus]
MNNNNNNNALHFSRKIKMSDPKLPYIADTEPKKEKYTKEEALNIFNANIRPTLSNCHWGALKLFYSELEFIVAVSKYINIDECLVVYIGAQPGFRLKHLFIKSFFPKMHMLLYDPLKFDIEEDEQITIKTGIAGWFSDEKISEVLKIANGRKILYISDIRLSDEDDYTKEVNIHEDMQKQQKWGIMMNAEFMLLKFRTFFYKQSPDEVDFINNDMQEEYGDKVVFKKNNKKHQSKSRWLLYLNGTIYSQIYAPSRSTECRLFVKKIKYYKDKDSYTKDEQEKYKLKYYNNITHESILNYFNMNTRMAPYVYKKSSNMTKYILGQTISYSSASEYYIMRKYLKYAHVKPTLKNILNKIIHIHTFLNNRYSNNLVICGYIKNIERVKKGKYSEAYDIITKSMHDELVLLVKHMNDQIMNLQKTKLINDNVKKEYFNSIKFNKNPFIEMRNNVIYLKK